MRWLIAKFQSVCGCGRTVEIGQKLMAVTPRRGKPTYLCEACGVQHERENAAADFDERQYSSGY